MKAEHGREKTHMVMDYSLKNETIAQSYLSSEFVNTPAGSAVLMLLFFWFLPPGYVDSQAKVHQDLTRGVAPGGTKEERHREKGPE